jgi:hypothetical protein
MPGESAPPGWFRLGVCLGRTQGVSRSRVNLIARQPVSALAVKLSRLGKPHARELANVSVEVSAACARLRRPSALVCCLIRSVQVSACPTFITLCGLE